MSGYKVTIPGQRNKDRHEFTRDPNVKLPDTVGKYISPNRNYLLYDNFIVFL
jgi:hypothetical protein